VHRIARQLLASTVVRHSPHQETRLISDANERVARLRFLLNLRRLYARPFFAMVHKKPVRSFWLKCKSPRSYNSEACR